MAVVSGPLTEMTPLGDNPLVTIVVASYNQEKYIAATIDSVLNQDYENINLIVVDGASTDGTMDIVRGYEDNPKFRWVSEADAGPNDAFTKGVYMAKGTLIGFLLSSDTYTPWAVKEAVNEFTADSNLAFVGGSVDEIDESGQPNGETWRHTDQRYHYSVDALLTLENYPPEQSTFFRRDVALAIDCGGLEFRWLHTFFFLHYMMEVARMGALSLYVPNHWGNYRRHPNALSKELSTRDVGLTVRKERNQACKLVSKRYRGFLSRSQIKALRQPGYLLELRYRVGTLRQIIPAIPSLLGYIRFGGTSFRPQGKGFFKYLTSFIASWLSKRLPRVLTSSRPKTPR